MVARDDASVLGHSPEFTSHKQKPFIIRRLKLVVNRPTTVSRVRFKSRSHFSFSLFQKNKQNKRMLRCCTSGGRHAITTKHILCRPSHCGMTTLPSLAAPLLHPPFAHHQRSPTVQSATVRPVMSTTPAPSKTFPHNKKKALARRTTNHRSSNNKNQQQQQTTEQTTEEQQQQTKQKQQQRKKWTRIALGSLTFIIFASLIDLFEPIISQKLFVRIELDEHDEAFDWIMNWLNQHSYTQTCTNLTVFSGSQYHRGMNSVLSALFSLSPLSTMNMAPVEDTNDDDEGGSGDEKKNANGGGGILFVPGQGRHFIIHRGHLMWIDYSKQKSGSGGGGGDSSSGDQQLKNLTITIWSPNLRFGNSDDGGGEASDVDRNRRKLVTDIILDAKRQYNQHKTGKTTIFCPDRFGERWEEVIRKPKRPLSSVILQQPETLNALLSDVRQFMSQEKFYADRGIPHRRGYLLYGPPGSGKTSTVQVIAGELNLDIYMLNISSAQMTDEKLNYLLHQAPKRSIVLLEDVDSCISATTMMNTAAQQSQQLQQRQEYDSEDDSGNDNSDSDDSEEEEEVQFHAGSYALMMRDGGGGSQEKVTVSGLLNAIDGVGAQEGRILFFTTNHAHRLQRALMRPGRIDVKREIGYVTPVQAKNLFKSFYRDYDNNNGSEATIGSGTLDAMAEQFVQKLNELQPTTTTTTTTSVSGVTPALLQGLFMENVMDPYGAIRRLPSYLIENRVVTTRRDEL